MKKVEEFDTRKMSKTRDHNRSTLSKSFSLGQLIQKTKKLTGDKLHSVQEFSAPFIFF